MFLSAFGNHISHDYVSLIFAKYQKRIKYLWQSLVVFMCLMKIRVCFSLFIIFVRLGVAPGAGGHASQTFSISSYFVL